MSSNRCYLVQKLTSDKYPEYLPIDWTKYPKLEINVNEKDKIVSVGKWISSYYIQLNKNENKSDSLKSKIVRVNYPDLYEYKLKDCKRHRKEVNELYCNILGNKFNYRLSGAMNKLWIISAEPEFRRFFYQVGKNYRNINDEVIRYYYSHETFIKQVIDDGQINLIPIYIAYPDKSPSELKHVFGKKTWKKLHHNSMTRNRYFAKLFTESIDDGQIIQLRVSKEKISEIISHNPTYKEMSYFTRHTHKTLFNLNFATLEGLNIADIFNLMHNDSRTNMTFFDCLKMISDNHLDIPKISLSSIETLHEKLVDQINNQKYSDEPFRDDFISMNLKNVEFDEIKSPLELVKEGRSMHHCAATYSNACKSKNYRAFKVQNGDERYTLGVELMGKKYKKETKPKYKLNQIYGACNSCVKSETIEVAEKFIKEILNDDKID